MASNYVFRGTADMSQHNAAIKKSASEVYKYQKQVQGAKAQLNNFNKSVGSTVGGMKSLMGSFATGNLGAFGSALTGLVPVMGTVTTSATGMGVAINTALAPVTLIAGAIAALGAVMGSSIKSFSEFETHLDSLQSLTGLSDAAMKDMQDSAIEMAKTYATAASDVVDSMRLIGSQAPQLLKNQQGLKDVTSAAIVLSKAAKIEVTEAAKGVTTVMNQMEEPASKATEIINTLAAASQQGAGDVAYLNIAFEKAGTAAKGAGVNFVETAALIETLAPKFSSAEVAGTQLNSTLLKLSIQGNNAFKPAVVGMQQALDNLAAAELSDAEMKDLVGARNVVLLKTLIEGRQKFDDYTKSLQGTDTAFEQMKTNGDNLQGAINRLKASWDAMLLSIGSTSVMQGIVSILEMIAQYYQECINCISDFIKAIDNISGSFSILEALQIWIKGVGLHFKATVKIIEVAVALIVKWWKFNINQMVTAWNNFKRIVGNISFFNPIKKACSKVIVWFKDFVNRLLSIWNKFEDWLGIGNGHHKIEIDTELKGDITGGGGGVTDTDITGGGGGGGKTPKTPKVKSAAVTKEEEKAEAGSIKDLQKKVEEINKQFENTNSLTDEQIAKLKEQKAGYEAQIKLLQEKYGLVKQAEEKEKEEVGSIKDLENKLQKVNDLLTNTNVSDERLDQLKKEKEELEKQIKALKLRNGLEKEQEQPKKSWGKEGIDEINDSIGAIDGVQSSMHSLIESIIEGASAWDIFMNAVDMVNSVLNGIKETIEAVKVVEELLGLTTTATAEASTAATAQEVTNSGAKVAAKSAEAVAGATASGAKLPFPANLAAIAAGIAAVIAAFAMIGSFADGGVIRGRTTIGDYNLARVNGGEMILNSKQQTHLFNAIDNNRLGGGGTLVAGEIKVKGSDLYIAMKNYGKGAAKLGKNIGIK